MSRVVFALVFSFVVFRCCTSDEEPKWDQTAGDKQKVEEKPETRIGVGLFDGFRPQYPGPYGHNSGPIKPVYPSHGSSGFFHENRPFGSHGHGRPHYSDSCRCTNSFNCPDLIVGSCGKGRRYCCYNGGGFYAWGSQPYYPVKRPGYYGPVDYSPASNNYGRPGYNGGYQFPDYYRPHIGFSLDRQPNGLPAVPYEDDITIFARAGNINSQKDKKQDNASS